MPSVRSTTTTMLSRYLCPNSEGSHPPEVAELMMPTVLEPTGFSQKVIAKETSCVAT